MIFNVTTVLLLIGFLKGILINYHFINAQALFLTEFSPKLLIYAILAPGLIWMLMLIYIRKMHIKRFIKIFLPVFAVFSILLSFLVSGRPEFAYFSVIWIFLAGFLNELIRWGFFELLERYVNPSRTGQISSYQILVSEIGVLISALFIQTFPNLSLPTLSWLTWILTIGILLLLMTFLNPRNLEIYYLRKPSLNSNPVVKNFNWNLVFGFLTLGLIFGLFRMSQDIVANTFFKNTYPKLEDLKVVLSQVMLFGSCVQIFTIFTTAKYVESERISPVKVITMSWILNFITAMLAIGFQNIYLFMLFMAMPKGIAGFYQPAISRMAYSFKYEQGSQFNSLQSLGYILIAGFIFIFIPNKNEIYYGLLFISPILAILFLYYFKKIIEKKLTQNLNSPNIDEAVKAAVGLSYLRPKGYLDSYKDTLEKSSHKALKKQIILGLGYSHANSAIDLLQEKFTSDQEEIQISVLEAMRVARTFRSTRFAVELLLSKKQSLTPRVRLSAAHMIAAMYGKKSIPILLLGLQEEDPRLIANTLEALNQFDDRELLDVVRPFVNLEIPRVRANALMVLSKFSDQNLFFKSEIEKTLNSNLEAKFQEKISIIYILGKIKSQHFKSLLKKTLNANSNLIKKIKENDDTVLSFFQTLYWALYRLKDEEAGKEFFNLLMGLGDDEDQFYSKSILHFYLQLNKIERFDLIDLFFKNTQDKETHRAHLIQIFEKSGFNFMEEVEYLKSLIF